MRRVLHRKDKNGNKVVSLLLESGKRIDMKEEEFMEIGNLFLDDYMSNYGRIWAQYKKIKVEEKELTQVGHHMTTLLTCQPPREYFKTAFQLAGVKVS